MSSSTSTRRVAWNSAISLGGRLLYLLTRIGLSPLILAHVTLAEYGIWAVCFIVMGYMGMSAFGVTTVYVRYCAEYAAQQRYDAIARLMVTGISSTLVSGLLVLWVLWLNLDGLIQWFNISPALRPIAHDLILGTACVTVLELSIGGTGAVLYGLQRIPEHTLVWVVSFCLEAVLIISLLLLGFGIYSLLWAFMSRYIVTHSWHWYLCRRYIPDLRCSWRLWDQSLLKLFIRYGGIVQISGLLSMVLYSIEKVIAGLAIGVQATALFDLGEKMPTMASQLTGTVNASVFPALTHLHVTGQQSEMQALYLQSLRAVCILTGLVMGFLAAFSNALLDCWIGAQAHYEQAALIMTLLTVPFHAHVTTGPASALYRSIDQPQRELFYPVSQALLVLLGVAVAWLSVGLSIESIALLVAVAMIISASWYLGKANRRVQVRLGVFARQVLLPGLLPYGLGWVLYQLWQPWLLRYSEQRVLLLGLLAVAGLSYLLCLAPVLYRMLHVNERAAVRARVQRLLRR